MNNKADIVDLSNYDNIIFFCMNCANLMTAFFNADKECKIHCPKCNRDILIRKTRRKYHFDLFEPKQNSYYYLSDINNTEKFG